MTFLEDLVSKNRSGGAHALPSICSAHPDVLAAALLLAKEQGRPPLIEATSNQVNQFGGYTGMTPAGFIAFVRGLAGACGVDGGGIMFGGDHLGPQAWRADGPGVAMARAKDLVRSYVESGFTKLHLDCSEGCAGEHARVGDDVCARRAAELAAVCERHAPDPDALSYVVGTEVPPPGGARADEAQSGMEPTSPERARETLARHRIAFSELGLHDAWRKVIALVVQPGLEFGAGHIDHFDVDAPDLLSAALADHPHLCFEAHSTDYQRDIVFPELARRGFAILKVGPALTFAYRQAVYALDHIARWLEPGTVPDSIVTVMEDLMRDDPRHWKDSCSGSGNALRLQLHFGYADRIRYYWPHPQAVRAVSDLVDRLAQAAVPGPLIEQYFPPDVVARSVTLRSDAVSWPKSLVLAQVQSTLLPYFFQDR